jgi:hypothetical protein
MSDDRQTGQTEQMKQDVPAKERQRELVLGTHVKRMVEQVQELFPEGRRPKDKHVQEAARTKYVKLEAEAIMAEDGLLSLVPALQALAADVPNLEEALGLKAMLTPEGDAKTPDLEAVREAVIAVAFGG